jgi:hypothetical protein
MPLLSTAVSRPPDWRWAAVLGFALLAPAALPAGGADRRLPEVRRREGQREPLLAMDASTLLSAPSCRAPVLARLDHGLPLRLLRQWVAPDGQLWSQVESTAPVGRPRRGWLSG